METGWMVCVGDTNCGHIHETGRVVSSLVGQLRWILSPSVVAVAVLFLE
jgi:hypothetical protein